MVGNILVPLLLSEEPMQKGSLILFAGLPTVVFNYMIAGSIVIPRNYNTYGLLIVI
jgi:hypothetical protein